MSDNYTSHDEYNFDSSYLTSEDRRRIHVLKDNIYAESTLNIYQSKWDLFLKFWKERCAWEDSDPRPADSELVVAYLAVRSEEVTSETVGVDVAAIRWGHVKDGYESPTNCQEVKKVMRGIRQQSSPEDGTGKRAPLMTEHIRAMVEALPLEEPGEGTGPMRQAQWLRALRDRTMALIGFASAFRGSELVEIEMEHIDTNPNGIEIFSPDPKGDPKTVGISYADDPAFCPIRSLKTWVHEAGIESGAIFPRVFNSGELGENHMTYTSLWHRLNKLAERAGIDSDQIGTHSFRRGHMTQGALKGASLTRLQKQAGHKDPSTTAEYIADARRMEQETSQELGL